MTYSIEVGGVHVRDYVDVNKALRRFDYEVERAEPGQKVELFEVRPNSEGGDVLIRAHNNCG